MNTLFIDKAREVVKARQERKKWEDIENILMGELKTVTNGQPMRGGGFVLTIETRRGSVDYSKIPLLIGVDLEVYRKPEVVCWKLGLELE